MGNSLPRIKLHYVKEQDRTVTGLIQILDLTKGTTIENLDVYVIGREKISFVSAQNFMTLKESHTFYKEKVVIKATDNEPTFSIKLPDDLPPSGHGGNYGKGVGYAIGYHILVEAQGNANIQTIEEFTVALGKVPSAPSGVSKGTVKFGKRTMEYEIPQGMPRGTTQTLKFKLSEGENQRFRVRLREEGKQLKGQEQTQSEIKYELEDEAIGTSWSVISLPISRYANNARDGTVLKISHVLEMTPIGADFADFIHIPVTLA